MTMVTNQEAIKDDEDIRFADDPEGKYRMYSLLSYVVVIAVLGLPMWWFTTRVYRAQLPLEEMLNFDIPKKTVRENSIPLSLEYDVLLTFINPDPQNLEVDLNIDDLKLSVEGYLKNVESIANFTVKSQWLYLVKLGAKPSEENGRFILEEEHLPLIVTPLEKKTWSHMSPRPTLNFVTYVSRCDAPLYIRSKERKLLDSNSFLNPRWGGITIVNADKSSCEKGMFVLDISKILSVCANHFQSLMGLRDNTPSDIRNLMKTKASEMIKSTKRTLKSLALLLSEISSIVISDEVGLKVQLAVDNVKTAEKLMMNEDVSNGLAAAKIAYHNSEAAFSDPSLLALLYFPDDQKYAVYIPLFLPVMIPVIISLVNFKKWLDKNQKKKVY